jgi:tight adherence protein B
MADKIFTGIALLIFVAAAFLVEAVWQWWFSTQSKAARRTKQRLQASMPSAQVTADPASLWLQRPLAASPVVEAWLKKVPGTDFFDRFLRQSGSALRVDQLLAGSLAFLLLGWLLGLIFMHSFSLALAGGLACACLPLLWLARLRAKRLSLLERQLPEAADLIARSLRAGHALPSTLQMVADEMPVPICDEFRIVSDEINYGPGLQQALQHLAERVPLDDLRFFVISILIQRETGGNLSDLMGNIATLVRQRLKFMRQIRALSAQGKLSAWILFGLPLVMGVLLSFTNPDYIDKLTTDPVGIQLLYASGVMQILGGFWMYRIIHIRV